MKASCGLPAPLFARFSKLHNPMLKDPLRSLSNGDRSVQSILLDLMISKNPHTCPYFQHYSFIRLLTSPRVLSRQKTKNQKKNQLKKSRRFSAITEKNKAKSHKKFVRPARVSYTATNALIGDYVIM